MISLLKRPIVQIIILSHEISMTSLFIYLLQDTIGAYSFLVFMFFVVLTAVFTYFNVPETKNRTFDDILSGFKTGKSKVKGGDHYELQDNANKAWLAP